MLLSQWGQYFFADLARKKLSKEHGYVAIVNGYKIETQDFKFRTKQEQVLIGVLQRQFGQAAQYFLAVQHLSLDPQENALQKMIKEILIDQLAYELGISVSHEQILKKLQDKEFVGSLVHIFCPELMLQGENISYNQILNNVKRKGYPIEKFENLVEGLVKKDIILDIIASGTYIPEFLVEREYIKKYCLRDLNIAIFDLNSYIQKIKKENISDQEVKKQFESGNKDKRYWISEKRSGLIYKVMPKSYSINVSEKEIEAAKEKSSSDNPDQIKNKIIEEKFERIFSLDAKQLAAASSKLKEFVDQKKLLAPQETKNQEAKEDSDKKISTLFSIKSNNGIGFYIDKGVGYIVQLTDIKKAYEPELESVRKNVTDDIVKLKAEQRLKEDLDNAKNSLSSGKSFSEVALKFGGIVKTIKGVSKSNQESLDELKKMDVPARLIFNLNHTKAAATYTNSKNGYLIQVSKIDDIDQKKFAEEKLGLVQDIYRDTVRKVKDSYIASLIKTAKIEYTQHL